MHTICYLGKRALTTNELGEKVKGITFSPDSIYVEQKSVKSNEFYQAMMNGLKPELLISVNKFEYYSYYDDMEDAGEQFAKVLHPITNKFIEYTIQRTFERNDDTIELTLTRGIQNASA